MATKRGTEVQRSDRLIQGRRYKAIEDPPTRTQPQFDLVRLTISVTILHTWILHRIGTYTSHHTKSKVFTQHHPKSVIFTQHHTKSMIFTQLHTKSRIFI